MTRVDLARLSDVSSGVPSGSSMPGSPTTNDLFYRTDRKLLYVYDGTRWLCTCPHWLALEPLSNLSASGIGVQARVPDSIGQLWIEALESATLVLSPNSGTAYWTLKVSYKLTDNSAADLSGATFSTGTTPDTHTNWVAHDVTVGGALATTAQHVYFDATKTSTPGNLFATGSLRYRIIGT